ncbi:carbohydrate kinase [Spongisporangium articulatum]|uniref:Carbohydrate kinase n=1 Tax=Spongisporangium articulatum TaxID=3362603 RepID=A0ABW8AR62_9ACTN
MKDILVIGEALVDVVVPPDGAVAEHPGGSPANVALGLARLGRSVDLLTRIGKDERGRDVAAHLERSGVRLAPGSVVDARTSTATARLDPDGVASYEFDLLWDLPPDARAGDVDAVHTGSIAAAVGPGAEAVARIVEEAAGRAVITYDPNARPALMGDPVGDPVSTLATMQRLIRTADVVKVSDEDLAWLLPGQDPLAVAEQWRTDGPALVVVTRGGRGASGVLSSGVVEVGAPPITVADTVGAGDAFMSGLLDALAQRGLLEPSGREALHGLVPGALAPILTHAVKVAAYTCTRPGADPPTRRQLASFVR